jgi:hypothetical protein
MINCPYCDRIFLHIKARNGHIGNTHRNKNQSQIMKNIWKNRKKEYTYQELKEKYWKQIPPNNKGKESKRKSRTNIEMLGEVRAKEISEKLRLVMYKRHIKYPEVLQKKCWISKGQKQLYQIIKEKYPQSILNYHYYTNNRHYMIDIYIPELHIGLEYNGCYFHGCPEHNQNIKKWNDTMFRLDQLNMTLCVIPVFACLINTTEKMKVWFSDIEQMLKGGRLYGITCNSSIPGTASAEN